MNESIPTQLRFPTIAGFTMRAAGSLQRPGLRSHLLAPGERPVAPGHLPSGACLWRGLHRQLGDPTGRENAAIMKRVVRRLREAWPDTHLVLRGDGHFANPQLMALCDEVDYPAGAWAKAYRVVVKAEVMGLGDYPRFVVNSMTAPTPEALDRDLCCTARAGRTRASSRR